MTTLLAYVFGLLLVGGILFLVASFAFGRGEEMVPALPEGTPLELPDDRPADGRDLREVRLSVVARGYRMDEVDWLLDRLAEQVDARDREIARLHSVLHVEPVSVTADDRPTDWSAPAPYRPDRSAATPTAADPDDPDDPPQAATTVPTDDRPLTGTAVPADDRRQAGTAVPTDDRPRTATAVPADDRRQTGTAVPMDDPAAPDAADEWSRPDAERLHTDPPHTDPPDGERDGGSGGKMER